MTKNTTPKDDENTTPKADENTTPKADVLVKARVLVFCEYGQPNDVVEVTAEQATSVELDAHPGAVAYAESLTG